MSRPRNTEPQANGARMRRNPDRNDSTVDAERTEVIQQAVLGTGTDKRPDILIAPPRRQPVVVRTEFAPTHTVEQDGRCRLGTSLHSTEEDDEGVLSVVLPESLKTADLETIGETGFRYARPYLNSEGKSTRWPLRRKWLAWGVNDLADAIEYLPLSERRPARGTEALERVVRNASGLLAENAVEVLLERIAKTLHWEPGEQAERMAAAIWVSTFTFHVAVEEQVHIPLVPLGGSTNKVRLLSTCNKTLEVNHWLIFSIARDLHHELAVTAVSLVMNRIAPSISDLAQLGATIYPALTEKKQPRLVTANSLFEEHPQL